MAKNKSLPVSLGERGERKGDGRDYLPSYVEKDHTQLMRGKRGKRTRESERQLKGGEKRTYLKYPFTPGEEGERRRGGGPMFHYLFNPGGGDVVLYRIGGMNRQRTLRERESK